LQLAQNGSLTEEQYCAGKQQAKQLEQLIASRYTAL
jgi:hypothetical protein